LTAALRRPRSRTRPGPRQAIRPTLTSQVQIIGSRSPAAAVFARVSEGLPC
jgi:hypothetical protein